MKYRVDVFGRCHMKHFFETEEYAREYAKTAKGDVFLLKETVSLGIYDVIEIIKTKEEEV